MKYDQQYDLRCFFLLNNLLQQIIFWDRNYLFRNEKFHDFIFASIKI